MLLNCLIEVSLAEIFDKIFKIHFFSPKMAQNMFLVHFVKVCQT